jgi:hypothetical protein
MELARDFITETTEQATHLHQWLQPLLVRRWSRNEKTVCRDESGKESIYTDGRQDPQNMDAYVRDSKVTGEPCCHMELRLKGRATVARHGITTFDDLQALDIERMFQSKMALLEVNKDLLPRLGKQFLLKGTPRFSRPSRHQGFRYDRYLRAAYFILRQCRTSQGRVDMQKLKQRMSRKKVKNPQNYFVRLDINALKVA